MPHCRRRLTAFSIAFLAQEALTTAATVLHRESFKELELQARGTDVLQDKYFIPAIAASGAFVLLTLVCLYFLGCCCNSRKMDEYYSRTAVHNRDSTVNERPTVNLNAVDGSDKYSNQSPTKTPPHPPPPSSQISLPSARLQQLEGQWPNDNQRPLMVPPPSHGFQPAPYNASPPSVMSVRHLNPTAASYQNRYERAQVPQVPRSHIQPESNRMSTMSSATSSTQIGSGVGEQPPFVYSPHQGNTLSYVSSTTPSVVAPAWDSSIQPRMPEHETPPPIVTSEKKDHDQQPVASPGPPAYFDDGGDRPVDMKKS